MTGRKSEHVPSAPFADWLNGRLAALAADGGPDQDLRGAQIALAAELGWGAQADHGVRKLYRARKQIVSSSKDGRKGDVPSDVIPRDLVEEALFCAGVPFEDVYPDLVEDVALEPDGFCRECDEVVTPIGGLCAWCEFEVGPSTGQRLAGRKLAA